MMAKPTMLIVDDSFTNRVLLHKIFSEEYRVEQAENGTEALTLLHTLPEVAVVILDIRMPVLDGYGVLEAMRGDERLKDIPVVINTASDDVESQLKALDYGAVDVLVKPINSQIALHRIRNIITRQEADRQYARNQMLEELLRQSEIDEKTGVCNKHAFCRKAAEQMRAHSDTQYVIVRWDVDRFKVYNDVFGIVAGDAYLAKIGRICRRIQHPDVVFGHCEADHFVACMPRDVFEQNDTANRFIQLLSGLSNDFDFIVRVGVYMVSDPSLDVTLMCDRALLALRSIKGNYSTRIAFYDESMRNALIEEQKITSEMDRALEQHQFVVYYQPQYNYVTESIRGAEALARWQHPEKGLIPPDKFIPVFERNGFVSKVDEFVWEQVCRFQRERLSANKPVVPVSVNISRRDIYNPHLCQVLQNLLSKYALPASLLRLEITESAYMENAQQLIHTVEKLRAAGFAVEMDDFGSGYSSLNTLKAVPVDLLKLDMKFLEDSESNTRGGSILTSVIRMAHWIKLPVLAEGVETREQAEYLKSIGCIFMQGYYFAKPMPVADFESLLAKKPSTSSPERRFADDVRGAANFLSASTQTTLLFNSFVGGAAIIEFNGSNVEALRVNDKFYQVLGTTREEYAHCQLHMLDRFDQENRERFLTEIKRAIETGEESSCELCSMPMDAHGKDIWTLARMRRLAVNDESAILYLSIENITRRVNLTAQLAAIMDNVPGGILDLELTDRIRTAYFNDITATMFGYSRQEYQRLYADSPLNAIAHDDLPTIHAMTQRVMEGKEQTFEATYHHRCANGSWRWVRLTGHVMRRRGDQVYASGILQDVDSYVKSERIAAKQAEEIERQRLSLQTLYDTIPCGIMQFSVSTGGTLAELISFNDTAWKIFGYEGRTQYVETIHKQNKLTDIHPEDLPEVTRRIHELSQSDPGSRVDSDHRIFRPDGSLRWVHAIFQKMHYADGRDVVVVVFTDITERKIADLQRLSSALFCLYDEVFEIDFTNNTSYMRASKQPNDPRFGRFISFDKMLNFLCDQYACPEERASIRKFYESVSNRQETAPQTLEFRYLDSNGAQRYASLTLVRLEGSIYLSCNRDITDQKNAQRIAKENKALLALANERKMEAERNRIFIESTGILVYDYDPLTDRMVIQFKNGEQGVSERTIEHYLASYHEQTSIGAEDRARMLGFLDEILKSPCCKAIEYRARHNGVYKLCRTQAASIANETGKVYRVIGQSSEMRDEHRMELSQRLLELTGSDYHNLSYERSLINDVLRILERAADSHSAVQTVLETVGRQFNVSRAYVIEEEGDGQHCTNTFEWCNDGVMPEIENLRHFRYPNGTRQKFISLFGESGLLACSDVSTLDEWLQSVLEAQSIRAVVLCAIMDAGVFHGYVGFDECRGTRRWAGSQIHTLQVVGQILGAFLFATRSVRSTELPKETDRAMQHCPGYFYIVDPDTCELLYRNAYTLSVTGNPQPGDVCYNVLMNRNCMCKDCPIHQLRQTGISVPTMVTGNGKALIMQAAPFLWHGRKAIALSGTDVNSFGPDPERVRQTEFQNDLERYAQTLFGLYDEIFELNFSDNVLILLSSKRRMQSGNSTYADLDGTIATWIARHIKEEERAAVSAFFDLSAIQAAFRSGNAPALEYTVVLPGEKQRHCLGTLLQLNAGRYLCCIRDITDQILSKELREQVLALQAKTEAQDRYRIVVEQTGTAVVDMNYETGEISCSEAYGKYAGSRYSQEEMLQNTGNRSLVHPADQPLLDRFFAETQSGAAHAEAVLRLMMTDGSFRWTKMSGTFIKNEQGKRIRAIGTFTDVDEEIRSKRALEQISERMRRIIANIPTGVAIYEVGEQFLPIYISDRACEMFGFTREECDLRIANAEPGFFMPDTKSLPEGSMEKLLSGQQLVLQKMHARRKDCSQFWVRAFCSSNRREDGMLLCYTVIADITEEVLLEQKSVWQAEKYKILSESADMITFDYFPLEDVMQISLPLPGTGLTEEVIPRYLETFDNYARIPNEQKQRFVSALHKASSTAMRGTYDFEGDYYHTGMRWYRAKFVSLAGEDGQVYRVIGRLDDINDIMRKQDQLRVDAQFDEVTGVFNKNHAVTALTDALLQSRANLPDAILFMDIDNFKLINDTYGHLEADGVLRQVGAILRRLFRKEDILARFGGDEFVIYMRAVESLTIAAAKADEIIQSVNRILINGKTHVCCSIGLTEVGAADHSYDAVLERADTALYQAKENGKNQYAVFEWTHKQ